MPERPITEQRLIELMEMMKAKPEPSLPPPASPSGPIANPTDRYAHLPETTREFLDELRKEDLDDYRRVLRLYRTAAALAWFARWLAFTVVAAFLATVTLGEKISALLSK